MDQEDNLDCPACGGPTYQLGNLGYLTHFRCRDCGATFFVQKLNPPDGEHEADCFCVECLK